MVVKAEVNDTETLCFANNCIDQNALCRPEEADTVNDPTPTSTPDGDMSLRQRSIQISTGAHPAGSEVSGE
jgi:hypothetical protein